MRKLLIVALALILYATVHEGLHALAASWYGEFEAFHVRPYGLEVTFRTPVAERQGSRWAVISGLPNAVTLLLGYLLLSLRRPLAALRSRLLRDLSYWVTLLFLLLDAFNLSIVPLLFGGDVHGIATGLGLPVGLVIALGFPLLLINRELAAGLLLPAFGVETTHPLFRPWFARSGRGTGR